MKNKLFRIFSLCILASFLVATHVTAQSITFPDVSTLDANSLLGALVEPVYALLILLSGYLGVYVPGIKKLSPFFRVLAFALAAGVGFYIFGVSFAKIATTYLFSSGLYLIILRNFAKSPPAIQ